MTDAEMGELLFRDKFPKELLDEVETWSIPSQTCFWAYAYNRAMQITWDSFVHAVIKDVEPLPVDQQSYLPFKCAEDSITAHEWFTTDRLITATA